MSDAVKQAEHKDAPEHISPLSSIIIPLVLGSAILFVAVLATYAFTKNQTACQIRELERKVVGWLAEFDDKWAAGDYESAEKLADNAVNLLKDRKFKQLDDHLCQSYFQRGMAKMQLAKEKDLQDAIDDFSDAIKFGKRGHKPYLYRASSYLKLKKYAEAEKDFSKVIEMERYHANAYFGRSHAREKLGDKVGAGSDFARAKQLGYTDSD